MKNKFPTDFFMGSFYQCLSSRRRLNEEGKEPSVQDIKSIPEGTTDFKVASDHYHRLEEDVRLFKELGLKAYRFRFHGVV